MSGEFIRAINNNDIEHVKRLLAAGASPDETAPDGSGRAPLIVLAAFQGRESIVEVLAAAGANINARASWGGTALIVAVRDGYDAIARFLIELNADRSAKDKYGKTALDHAIEQGRTELRALLEAPEDAWQKLDDDNLAYIEVQPALKLKLTRIFNFRTRERESIDLDYGSDKQSSHSETFDDISQESLREAFNVFIDKDGEADEDYVFFGADKKPASFPLR